MGKLVQQHGDQVDACAVVRVQPIVPVESSEAWSAVGIGSTQTAVEPGSYVIGIGSRWSRKQIGFRQFVAQGNRIPGAPERRSGKIRDDLDGTGRTPTLRSWRYKAVD